MVYHSDDLPLDIGNSLTGLLPMHCVYWNFDTIKNCPFLVQSNISDFQEPYVF